MNTSKLNTSRIGRLFEKFSSPNRPAKHNTHAKRLLKRRAKITITMKQIARLKDLLAKCEDIDLPLPTTDSAEEMASYFVLQFADDNDILVDILEIATGQNFEGDISEILLEEILEIMSSFFTVMPRSLFVYLQILMNEKHMQYIQASISMAKQMAKVVGENIGIKNGILSESLEV